MVVLCTLLSGGMLYLSLGIDSIWILAWFAPVPLLWVAYGSAPRRQLALGAVVAYSIGQFYLFQCYGEVVGPLTFLKVLLPLLFPAPLLFAAAMLFTRFAYQRLPPIAAFLAFPASWTSAEYLISLVSPHGSFGSLAYSQVSMPLLIQAASLFGLYAVTFLMGVFASAAALLLRVQRDARLSGSVGIGLCALNICFGAIRLHEPLGAPVRAAALADDALRDVAMRFTGSESAREQKSRYESYTTEVAQTIWRLSAAGAKIIVLPEGGLIGHQPWSDFFLAPLASETRTQIVAGVYRPAPPGDLAVSFAADGSINSYEKRHLIPVLEAQFHPGHSAAALLGNNIAVVICKDMDFPRTIRSDAQSGIKMMMVPAGDFVLDDWIHARIAVMRGVENGFSVLRSASQGLLTASDARGRLLARQTTSGLGMVSIVADLPLGPGMTLYSRIGDVLAWFALAVTVGLGALALRKTPSMSMGDRQQTIGIRGSA